MNHHSPSEIESRADSCRQKRRVGPPTDSQRTFAEGGRPAWCVQSVVPCSMTTATRSTFCVEYAANQHAWKSGDCETVVATRSVRISCAERERELFQRGRAWLRWPRGIARARARQPGQFTTERQVLTCGACTRVDAAEDTHGDAARSARESGPGCCREENAFSQSDRLPRMLLRQSAGELFQDTGHRGPSGCVMTDCLCTRAGALQDTVQCAAGGRLVTFRRIRIVCGQSDRTLPRVHGESSRHPSAGAARLCCTLLPQLPDRSGSSWPHSWVEGSGFLVRARTQAVEPAASARWLQGESGRGRASMLRPRQSLWRGRETRVFGQARGLAPDLRRLVWPIV